MTLTAAIIAIIVEGRPDLLGDERTPKIKGKPNLTAIAEAMGKDVDRVRLTRHRNGGEVSMKVLARYLDAASKLLGRPVMVGRDGAGGWVASVDEIHSGLDVAPGGEE